MTLHITANKQPLIFLDEELGVIDGQNTFCTVAASLSQAFPGVPHLAVARVCRAVLEPGVTAGYHVPHNCWSSQSCFYHQGSAQQVSVQGKLSQSPQWAVGSTTSRQDWAGAAKSSRVLLPSFFLSMLASLCHHKLPSGWSQTTEAIKFLPFYCCEPGVQLHCQQAFITVSSFTAHVHVWRTEGFNLHLAFSAHIKYLSVY